MARERRGVTEGSNDGLPGLGSPEWHSPGDELHNVTMTSDDDMVGEGGSIPLTDADLHASFSRQSQSYRMDSSDALPGSLAATSAVKRGSTSLAGDATDVAYMATEGRQSQLSRRSLAMDIDDTPLATILESPTRKSPGHVGSRLSQKDQRRSSRASSDGTALSFSRRLSHRRSSTGAVFDDSALVMDEETEAAISPSRLRSSLRESLSSVHEARSSSEPMATGSIRRTIKEQPASSVSSLTTPDGNPSSMGGVGSTRSSYHRGSMGGRMSHRLEEEDLITQDLTESTPQRYSELMQPKEATRDVLPPWESSAERSQRRSLHDLSTKPETPERTSVFGSIIETELPKRLSRSSIGGTSPGHDLAGKRSRRSSVGGMSNRQSAERSSPRDSAPDSATVSGYGTSAVVDYRGSTTTSSGRLSHRSTTERRSQSLGESRSSHSSRENNREDGAYDVCIDVDVVTNQDLVVVDGGNAYVAGGTSGGGGYEEYHIGTSHHGRINDPNESMMEDEGEEEEEEDDAIFLIKDDLTSGGAIGSMTTVQHPHELPLYTARETDAYPGDNQLNTGREGLDFSFSHNDVAVLAPKPDDALSHALSARENFSFSGTGAQSPHSGDVHSLTGFNGSTQLLGSPMHVEDLDTVQQGSTDIDVDGGGENANTESLSFSERVYRFVASLRTGEVSETRNETQSQETNIPITEEVERSTDNESLIPRDTMHGNEGEIGGSSSRIGNQEINARQDDTSAFIHTPMNAAPVPPSDRLQVRSDGQSMGSISHLEEETHGEGLIKRLNPVDPSSYLNSSSSSSYGVLSTPREGSSAKHAFTPPVVTNATEVDTDNEQLHMTSFFSNLIKDNRKYDEIPSPYDEMSNMFRVKGTSPSAKRIKLVNGKASSAATPGDRTSTPDWMTASDTVTGDASNLINATFQSIKVLVGAKLSERGYEKDQRASDKSIDLRDRDKATDFQSLSKSLFQSSAPHRKVYEDTKALVSEMIEKLRRINDIKDQFNRCCVILNKGPRTLLKGRDVYCSLVRSSRRIAKSISESESVVALQQKLMIVKVERLTFLKRKVANIERRNQLYTAIVPKVEHLHRLVSVLSNAYTATGIRVVPLSVENQNMCWCFIISYNSDLNMKRCGRRFRRAWHNDLVRLSDMVVDELMHRPFQYHRIKLDNRFNPEINMLVYLRPSNDHVGSGIQATRTRSVMRFYDDSPGCGGDVTSTPRDRAYVPAFRSHELPSNGPASFKSPFGSNRMICSINGVRSEMVAGFHGKEVAFTDVLEDKMEESPIPMLSHDVSICDVNWEDELDLEDIRHGLRIVFTCPRVKAGGETARVWEQVLLYLIEGANQRIDRFISRLRIDRTSMSLLALMREVMDYGSVLSARIRVVQRELLQLFTSTSGATIVASDDAMTITSILMPKESTRASLQCAISAKVQDLLDKGSYACAAMDIRVRALQPEYDHLAYAVNAAIAGSEKRATIYDVIASACARNGHELYN